MLNVGLQFLAFPLYSYSINNFWRQEAERVERETNGTGVARDIYYPDGDRNTQQDQQQRDNQQ